MILNYSTIKSVIFAMPNWHGGLIRWLSKMLTKAL